MSSTRTSRRPAVIGHRGAAAYAPENTLPSYALAIRQGADAVELDLHPTLDGILVCLHDQSLERTTNVREMFADRGREEPDGGSMRRRWFVRDFTLAELERLDCGPAFDASYRDVRIPTFAEVLDWARGKTTILAELKEPDVYERAGIDLLAVFDATIRRHGVAGAGSGDAFVTVQSFHEPTVRRAGDLYRGRLPVALLREAVDAVPCLAHERLADIATFATGVNPEKSSLIDHPELVARAHEAGLTVTPWTFRAKAPGRFRNVHDEIAHYVCELEVDGVITDNPDAAAGLAP